MAREAGSGRIYYAALLTNAVAVAQLQARAGPFWLNFQPLCDLRQLKGCSSVLCLGVSREWWEDDCKCLPWLGGGPLTQVGKGRGKSCLHQVPNGACAASPTTHHPPGMDISPPKLWISDLVHLCLMIWWKSICWSHYKVFHVHMECWNQYINW